MRMFTLGKAASAALLLLTLGAGCGDDDEMTMTTDGGGGDEDSGNADSDAGAEPKSLCEKYGGADNVETVIKTNVIGAIAGDCRISTHFTSLPEDRLSRVSDCLAIQAQELFGCEGVTYSGSEADNGLPCRSMADSHEGLEISQGDFDALIEDVVAGLSEAGVESDDIQAAAPALLGLEGDIVEQPDMEDPTMDSCGAEG